MIEDLRRLAASRGEDLLSAEYANRRSVLQLRCHAGHEWQTAAVYIMRGFWCPTCGRKNECAILKVVDCFGSNIAISTSFAYLVIQMEGSVNLDDSGQTGSAYCSSIYLLCGQSKVSDDVVLATPVRNSVTHQLSSSVLPALN